MAQSVEIVKQTFRHYGGVLVEKELKKSKCPRFYIDMEGDPQTIGLEHHLIEEAVDHQNWKHARRPWARRTMAYWDPWLKFRGYKR